MSQQTIVSIYTEKKFKQESKIPWNLATQKKNTLNFMISILLDFSICIDKQIDIHTFYKNKITEFLLFWKNFKSLETLFRTENFFTEGMDMHL